MSKVLFHKIEFYINVGISEDERRCRCLEDT